MSIQFAEFSTEEQAAVSRIIDRASEMAERNGRQIDRLSLHMDLSAAHAAHPLRLEELVEADDFNFAHDVFGIVRHMDRATGILGGCFVPRYAASPSRVASLRTA